MDTYYTLVEVSAGWLLLVGRNGCLIEIKMPRASRDEALGLVPAGSVEAAESFGELPERLRLYFEGHATDFSDVRVDFCRMGQFAEHVLKETMKVPFGKLVSYGALAAIAGSPGAARAVGNAMARNPVPFVVPCHRVVHGDGTLGGYGGGLDLKRKLLAMEGISF